MTLHKILFAAALLSWTTSTAQQLPWTMRSSGTISKLRSVAASTPSIWIAVGDAGTVLRSTDGGNAWKSITTPAKDILNGVAFRDSIGLAVGVAGMLIRSTDAGATWSSVTRPTTKILNAVAISPNTAIAIGEEGTLVHSSDTGLTWLPGTAGVANQFFAVALEGNAGIAGSYGGAVAITGNGGVNYGATVLGSAPLAFFGVSFTSGPTAIMVGFVPGPTGPTLILRSDIFGITWTRQNPPQVGTLQAVAFTDPRTGITVGEGGAILATADTGNHWTQQPSGVTVALNGVAFSDPTHGIAVGDSGTILQTSQGGVTAINSRLGQKSAPPENFALAQNYPNPFNPTTIIRYELPRGSHVSLQVFNLVGQQVATLVDEEKPAGTFEVRFDASGLASGVYLYRLNAGEFVTARRLVVVR